MTARPGPAASVRPATAVDWDGLKRRLAMAEQRAHGQEPDAELRMRTLRERARIAARVPERHEDGAAQVQVVEFVLAYERHAIETAWVKEVLALRELAALPGTPPFVGGIINVRGRIVAVVDLKVFFGLPDRGLPDLNRVIIVGNDEIEFGLLADAVAGVRVLREGDIQPPVPTLAGLRHEYLRGLTADRLAVLDAGRLVADPRLVLHNERQA